MKEKRILRSTLPCYVGVEGKNFETEAWAHYRKVLQEKRGLRTVKSDEIELSKYNDWKNGKTGIKCGICDTVHADDGKWRCDLCGEVSESQVVEDAFKRRKCRKCGEEAFAHNTCLPS